MGHGVSQPAPRAWYGSILAARSTTYISASRQRSLSFTAPISIGLVPASDVRVAEPACERGRRRSGTGGLEHRLALAGSESGKIYDEEEERKSGHRSCDSGFAGAVHERSKEASGRR
jgi:hypothetical protein